MKYKKISYRYCEGIRGERSCCGVERCSTMNRKNDGRNVLALNFITVRYFCRNKIWERRTFNQTKNVASEHEGSRESGYWVDEILWLEN